jgi:hypothetical protein
MPQKLRKLIGTVLLVAFIVFYALAAMVIASAKLPGASGFAQFLYFLVAGLLWVIPAGALIWWMARPGRASRG